MLAATKDLLQGAPYSNGVLRQASTRPVVAAKHSVHQAGNLIHLVGGVSVLVHQRNYLAIGTDLGRTPVCNQTAGVLPQALVLLQHHLHACSNLVTRTGIHSAHAQDQVVVVPVVATSN